MKSEKEKMLSGENYDGGDSQLVAERLLARELCFKFNQASPTSIKVREEIIDKLINIKKPYHIEANFNCDYGYNINAGKNFYANFNCTILDTAAVVIGDNVLLGPNVSIYTAAHPTDPKERLDMVEFAKPVSIGSNVWIGGGAIICPGVSIGDNVTIGAGSVVVKDIPTNTIAVGNPAKVIKHL